MLNKALSGSPLLLVALGCALVSGVSSPVLGREDPSLYVARADQMGEAGSGTRAIEDVLFPALAAMDAAPEWMARDRTRFVRCVPGGADWAEAEAWVMGDPQREVLKALAACTDGSGGTKWVLGIPYGVTSVDPAWVEKGLTVSLSQDNLLASARFGYFGALEALRDLVLLEVHRLSAAKEGGAALEAAIDLVRLGRYVSERPFAEESLFGYALMSCGLQSMRDAAYTYPEAYRDRQVLVDAAGSLANDDLKWTQFVFPEGERVAAEQLMARTIVERRGVNEEAFIETMSGLSSTERPLRRFGAADRWRAAVAQQSDWFDTEQAITRVWGDLEKRWDYRVSNPQHARMTDLEMLSSPANEMVVSLARRILPVFSARRVVLNELGATRIALASVAWKVVQFDWPPGGNTAALRPNFLSWVDVDLYNWHPRREASQPYGYFVPIRDVTFALREDPHPHAVLVSVDPARPYLSAMFQAGSREIPSGTLTAIAEPGTGPAPAGELSAPSGEVSPARIMAESLTEDLSRYYDLSTQKIDPERYREYLAQGGAAATAEAVVGLASILKMVDPSVSAENVEWGSMIDRVMTMVPPGMPANYSMGGSLTEVGVDTRLYRGLFLKLIESIKADPVAERGLRQAVGSGTPGVSETERIREVLTEAMLSPEVIEMQEQLIGQVLGGPFGGEIRAAQAASAMNVVAFQRMVDDSQFVLYSLGPDRYDNRARNVGSQGDDILYWPPVVSLYRESLAGE